MINHAVPSGHRNRVLTMIHNRLRPVLQNRIRKAVIGLAYGKLAHRLLEQLPAIDASRRRDWAVTDCWPKP